MRRQLLLLNLEYLVDAALPASVQAAAPTTLEFLARCASFEAGPLLLASMLCQPSNSLGMCSGEREIHRIFCSHLRANQMCRESCPGTHTESMLLRISIWSSQQHSQHMGTLVLRLCHSQVHMAPDPQGADDDAELTMLCRCNRISSGGEPAQISMSACNINASANYMVRHCAWRCSLGCKHYGQACGVMEVPCIHAQSD